MHIGYHLIIYEAIRGLDFIQVFTPFYYEATNTHGHLACERNDRWKRDVLKGCESLTLHSLKMFEWTVILGLIFLQHMFVITVFRILLCHFSGNRDVTCSSALLWVVCHFLHRFPRCRCCRWSYSAARAGRVVQRFCDRKKDTVSVRAQGITVKSTKRSSCTSFYFIFGFTIVIILCRFYHLSCFTICTHFYNAVLCHSLPSILHHHHHHYHVV